MSVAKAAGILALCALLSVSALAQTSPFFDGSFADALKLAKEENKPILVYFDLEFG